MIHDSARRAVGWIEIDGGLTGHCVLVGPRQAVTCAHVLSRTAERPEGTFQLRFPNLALNPMARVTGWRPFDPGLAPGSDIAVLTFVDDTAAPLDSWARLDGARPGAGAEVVVLDFQTARGDGDAREGRPIIRRQRRRGA